MDKTTSVGQRNTSRTVNTWYISYWYNCSYSHRELWVTSPLKHSWHYQQRISNWNKATQRSQYFQTQSDVFPFYNALM